MVVDYYRRFVLILLSVALASVLPLALCIFIDIYFNLDQIFENASNVSAFSITGSWLMESKTYVVWELESLIVATGSLITVFVFCKKRRLFWVVAIFAAHTAIGCALIWIRGYGGL